ncbi:hypothetical protein PS712_04156 [Pseudomonas fluorescens]|uniref:Bacteriophage Mu GpT domain-containing protein n=1 Tax=Pseudomonas fluorescens TaxID=294 RepID=A0A5E7E462_PSEFL|nr:prohead protease/major capsid protein fusion protein [Pseudomonas fluorescens]VVO20012.1 hypothetical protein PS712_04156 [Pseudomonas fluorescens]
MPTPNQATTKKTHETPAFSLRAAVRPDSVDIENRTVELTWTTGAKGRRWSWDVGSYMEELEVSDKAVRLDRLNNGAPLLGVHNQYELRAVLAVVERAWLVNGEGHALVRFSKREDADVVFKDVIDGILRNVSVGYAVHRYELIEEEDDKLPTYRAVDWEPLEISLVPIGFDDGAKVRSAKTPAEYTGDRFKTIFEVREAETPPDQPAAVANTTEEDPMTEEEKRAAEELIRRQAEETERKRSLTIRQMAKKVGLGDDIADDLVARGVSIADASAALIDKVAERQAVDQPETRNSHATIISDRDDSVVQAFRSAACDAIVYRAGGAKLTDAARDFGGMSLQRLAEECLTRANISSKGLMPMELVARAMTTSDLPAIFANIMNKSLRAGYESAPRTFVGVFRETSNSDFKQVQRTQLSGAPALVKVGENGEFEYGKLSDAKEVYALATYGKILSMTRQAVINDDLDALTRVPQMFGRSAADLESDLVWAIVNSNPNMGDTNALFSSAHGNLSGTSDAIGVKSIGAAKKAMRLQKGLEGRLINVMPKHLIVPADQETAAEQYLSGVVYAAKTVDTVPAGMRNLNPVVEPRLTDTSWFLAADYNQVDTIEYCYLQGAQGVYLESREGFNVDGVEVKARHDFAAKAIDWRGLYKNPGALPA